MTSPCRAFLRMKRNNTGTLAIPWVSDQEGSRRWDWPPPVPPTNMPASVPRKFPDTQFILCVFLMPHRGPAGENSRLPRFQPDFSDYKQDHCVELLRERKEVTGRERKLQEKEEMNHFLVLRAGHTQAGWAVGPDWPIHQQTINT